MTIPVEFDETVSRWAGGASGMEVKAASVHAALIQVAKAYPAFHMFNCDGELRGILRIQCNGESVTVADPLAEGDTLRLSVG